MKKNALLHIAKIITIIALMAAINYVQTLGLATAAAKLATKIISAS